MDGFNDVLVIAREIKEAATLARGTQFREDILAGERHEIVGGIKSELGSKMPKYPWCVVLELKIVFGRRYQLISGSGVVLDVSSHPYSTPRSQQIHTYQMKTCAWLQSQRESIPGPSLH